MARPKRTELAVDPIVSVERTGPGIVQEHQRGVLVHLARRLAQVVASSVAPTLSPSFARSELGVLVAISQAKGLDQKRLASMMVLDATTIGQLIDNLESKALVKRAPSTSDRRLNLLDVTDAGRKFAAECRAKALKDQDQLLSSLSIAERRTLLELMIRVIESNPEHDRPGGGRRPPKSATG